MKKSILILSIILSFAAHATNMNTESLADIQKRYQANALKLIEAGKIAQD